MLLFRLDIFNRDGLCEQFNRTHDFILIRVDDVSVRVIDKRVTSKSDRIRTIDD